VLAGCALVALVVGPAQGRFLRVVDDPSSHPGGEFGRALVAVGSDLAVGAPGSQMFDHDHAGVVRLYGSDDALLRTLEAQNPVADAAFGSMLAASDGLLYVGAPGDRPTGLGGIGAVYVFDVATGALVRIVRAPDPNANTGAVASGPLDSKFAVIPCQRAKTIAAPRGWLPMSTPGRPQRSRLNRRM
jgi:hypothetical protein